MDDQHEVWLYGWMNTNVGNYAVNGRLDVARFKEAVWQRAKKPDARLRRKTASVIWAWRRWHPRSRQVA